MFSGSNIPFEFGGGLNLNFLSGVGSNPLPKIEAWSTPEKAKCQ